eukprot:TRINITY_DN19045_c0_g1_i1.p1 TRINITY_DN19045_c0_g1~~TRINITY_DN19045_c0_g1_i1.p1  ORF type:complete len:286 (+),score=47.99 TRINITY_DN19045_c0_g1_i1:35-859(+)
MTDSFARFADLLGANADALHSSFASILGLVEIFGHLYREIGVIASGFAFFRFITKIFRKVFGIKEDPLVSEFERSNKKRGFSWNSVLMIVIIMGVGLLIKKLVWQRLKQIVQENDDDEDTPEKNPTAVALYDYGGQRPEDLQFKKGDIITILDKPYRFWWIGEIKSVAGGEGVLNKGKKGLFPANFVNTTTDNPQTEQQSENEQKSGSPKQQSSQIQLQQQQQSPRSFQPYRQRTSDYYPSYSGYNNNMTRYGGAPYRNQNGYYGGDNYMQEVW